ncbi:MAG TPA: superoxide dismutase family protein [Vicinamibacterales bacterium]|nr:superoxide dismutase family protein [Vicinamibacterales bacterium]
MKQLIRGVMTGAGLAAVMLTVSLAAQGPVKVDMKDAQGQSIGSATLTQSMGMVHIQLDLKNLKPGPHALHVHMTAKCEGPAFTSAGGHFNPAGKKHGLESAEGPHAGDMENFTVAADGTAKGMVMAKGITLGSEANSVFSNGGTALVVHAGPDDMKTDPAGAAGDRIACGTVTK